MKKLISLSRILAKNTSIFDTGKSKFSKFLLPILIIAFVPFGVMIGYFTSLAYDGLIGIQQAGAIIAFALGMTSVFVFFFGIFHTLGSFYYSEDINILLPMPFKPYHILGSKLLVLLLYEYLTEAILLAPVLIVFGIKSNAGIAYILMAIVIYLLLPIIALIMSSIIVMVIMRFTNVGKHKERLRYIGGILALFMALGMNFLFQSRMQNMEDESAIIRMFAEGNNTFISLISKIFPGTNFATNALTNPGSLEGLLMFLLFVTICAAGLAIFFSLGQAIYFTGVLGMSEVSAKRQKLNPTKLNQHTVQKTPVLSLMSRDIKVLLRSPVYFLNCVLMTVLMPIIFVVAFLFIPSSDPEIEMVMNFLTQSESQGQVLAGIISFLMVMAGLNSITPTAFSRDGKSTYVLKYLPASMNQIVYAKVLVGIAFSVISAIICSIGFILLSIPMNIIIPGLSIGILAIILINQIGIVFDLLNPKLSWDNEQQAVKQNVNVLFNLVAIILIAVVLVFGSIKLNLSFEMVMLLSILGFIALNMVIYSLIKYKLVPRFNQMDM